MNYREDWVSTYLDFSRKPAEQRRLAICFNLWASPILDDFDARIKYYSKNIAIAIARLRQFSDINEFGDIYLFVDDRIDINRIAIPGCITVSKTLELRGKFADSNPLYTTRFKNYSNERLTDYEVIMQFDDDVWLVGELSFEELLGKLDEDVRFFWYQYDIDPENDHRLTTYPHYYEYIDPHVDSQLKKYMLTNFDRLYAPEPDDPHPLFPSAGFQIFRNPYPEFMEFVDKHSFILDDEILVDIWKYAYGNPLGLLNDFVPWVWVPYYYDEFQGMLNVGAHSDDIPEDILEKIKLTV